MVIPGSRLMLSHYFSFPDAMVLGSVNDPLITRWYENETASGRHMLYKPVHRVAIKKTKVCNLASKVSELSSVDKGMQTLNSPSDQMWTFLMDGKFSQPIKCFQLKALSGDYNANVLCLENTSEAERYKRKSKLSCTPNIYQTNSLSSLFLECHNLQYARYERTV